MCPGRLNLRIHHPSSSPVSRLCKQPLVALFLPSRVPGEVLAGSRWASDWGSRGLLVRFLVGFWWAWGLLHDASFVQHSPKPHILFGLGDFKVDPKMACKAQRMLKLLLGNPYSP